MKISLLYKKTFIRVAILMAALTASCLAVHAGTGDGDKDQPDSVQGGSPTTTYYRFGEDNKTNFQTTGDTSFPDGKVHYGPHGETKKKVDCPVIPGKIWPIVGMEKIP